MKSKDVPGYRGRYRLYEDGRMWSYRSKRFLKVQENRDGYYYYILCLDYKLANKPIHRWLYTTFVGDIPQELQINHIDGDKKNNELSNLEVVTPKENTRHAWRNGLVSKRFGSATNSAKLKEDDIPKIFELSRSGLLTQGEIAKMFGVDPSNISYILSGKTWSHVAT